MRAAIGVWPVHPFIAAGYPVLFLLAGNLGQAEPSDAWPSLLVVLGGAASLFAVGRALLGDRHRAGLYTTLFFVLVFTDQAVVGWGEATLPDGPAARWADAWLWVEAILLVVAVPLLRRKPAEPHRSTSALNIAAVVLVLFPLAEIVRYVEREPPLDEVEQPAGSLAVATSAGSRPDIYHIVLDAYARADVLKEFYGQDNSEFIDFLRSRDFYVAEDSATNYSATRLLLPSMLSFGYLDGLADRMGRKSRRVAPLLRMISANRVLETLRAAGYEVITVSTASTVFVPKGADDHVRLGARRSELGEFDAVLVAMTPFPRIMERLSTASAAETLGPAFHASFGSMLRRARIEHALEQLGALASRPGPKYVFAHIHSPHTPFVLGDKPKDTGLFLRYFRSYSNSQLRRFARAYKREVRALNERVMGVVDRILEDSAEPPVIVIHGDHGLRLLSMRNPKGTCMVESFAILNALHLPEAPEGLLYPTISPVNTYRVIFDTYFGTQLGRLDDRSFFANNRTGIYNFRDITDRIDTCTNPRAKVIRRAPSS